MKGMLNLLHAHARAHTHTHKRAAIMHCIHLWEHRKFHQNLLV